MLDEFDKIQEAIDNHVLSPNVPENISSVPRVRGALWNPYWILRIKRLREEYGVLFSESARLSV